MAQKSGSSRKPIVQRRPSFCRKNIKRLRQASFCLRSAWNVFRKINKGRSFEDLPFLLLHPEELYNETSDKQVLRLGNKISISPAGVVFEAAVTLLPITQYENHPAPFLSH